MVSATTTMTARWTTAVSGDIVVLTRLPGTENPAPHELPRVWSGHGLALPVADLPGFTAVLSEVMKSSAYWTARARCPDPRAGDAGVWTVPRYDEEDGFLYLKGPCGPDTSLPGYRPVSAFAIALPHVRGLRIRATAYLQDGTRQRRFVP